MPTPAQLAANRANAQKSTGSRTAEGKDASRFNALKHASTPRPSSSPAKTGQPDDNKDGPKLA